MQVRRLEWRSGAGTGVMDNRICAGYPKRTRRRCHSTIPNNLAKSRSGRKSKRSVPLCLFSGSAGLHGLTVFGKISPWRRRLEEPGRVRFWNESERHGQREKERLFRNVPSVGSFRGMRSVLALLLRPPEQTGTVRQLCLRLSVCSFRPGATAQKAKTLEMCRLV